ncbi:MAG TPA: 4-alpha-glucanotransferase [Stellaceae bacterium]|nr:4-alpha-glucanotransferase [Stellaceae bacterium]
MTDGLATGGSPSDLSATDPVDRLSDLAGLSRGYWDGLGQWRDAVIDDRLALLAGLRFPVDSEAALATALRGLETAAWTRALPPVEVHVVSGTPIRVVVTVPATAARTLGWRLVEEGGAEHAGTITLRRGAALDRHESPTGPLERHAIVLPTLPLGYHTLEVPSLGAAMTLILAPARCYQPETIRAGGRVWGVSVQLYALRSTRNWGIGDFSDLAHVAVLAGRAGAAMVGLNPVHAHSLVKPEDCSPYSPSSRLFLDGLSVDVEAIADFAESPEIQALVGAAEFQRRLAALREAPLVDYAAVAAMKVPVLYRLHAAFRANHADPTDERRRAFEAFVAAGGEMLRRFALFEGIRHRLKETTGTVPWWRDWPTEWREPDHPEATDDALGAEVDFQLYIQWQADLQLAAAAEAGRVAGLSIGLYRDLAVAADGDSAEAWSHPDIVAQGLTVGAPPDAMSRNGQNWGMPPPNPRAMENAGFAPWSAMLAANMRHAGALRIDHVMAMARLFVIPAGRDGSRGTYLAYPFEAMAHIVALESVRHQTLVIGEDLGSVPEGFRDKMALLGVLSYRVLQFERFEDGALKAPANYPALSLAMASTHDLPTLAGYWTGRDIERRQAAGLIADAAQLDREQAERAVERRRLLTLFDWQKLPLDPPVALPPEAVDRTTDLVDLPPGLLDGIHRLIARAASAVAMVQLDDVIGEIDGVNMPGTYQEYPNWRRKQRLAIDGEELSDRLAATAAIMRAERPSWEHSGVSASDDAGPDKL